MICLVWLPLAAMLQWVETQFLGETMERSTFAGMGATPYVWLRKTKAPMSDRVLMAWVNKLCMVLHRRITGKRIIWLSWPHKKMYMFWKWLFMAIPLMLMHNMFGFSAACFLALVWTMMWQYDYWDIYIEATVILLALTGNLPLAILGAVLGPLSRESTLLVIPVYTLATGDWVGGIVVAAVWATSFLLRKRWVGPRERYTHRCTLFNNMVWRWWLKFWLSARDSKVGYLPFGVFWILLSCTVLLLPMPGTLQATAGCMPILLLLGGPIFGYLWEPRAVANTAIWVGPALIMACG